ncbi:MAG: hypothetical protein LC118_14875, partial [Dehalococcoidia bacterium]|nr:hypothetical protein [Dehalococcoidia bacterium]
SDKSTAPATEPKPAPAADESKAAASTAETQAASVQAAAEALRARVAEENLRLGVSDNGDSGDLPGLRTPGSQSSDSGTAGAGPGGVASSSGTGGGAGSSDSASSGTATSEGGRDPFGGNLTGRLDADMANALSQLDASRPDLRGGLDVFQPAPGSTATTPASGGQEPFDTGSTRPNSGSDPGAEHAADVAGQVTGGLGSTGSMLGDRHADAMNELGIMGGLIGDAAAKESSPSVASTSDPDSKSLWGEALSKWWDDQTAVFRALGNNLANGFNAPGDIYVEAQEMIIEAQATPAGLRTGFQNFIVDTFGSGDEPEPDDGLPPIPPLDPETVKNAPPEEPDAADAAGSVGRPDPEGGKPTPAQIAFRQSLRDALGGAQTGSGDIDPADNGGVLPGGSHFAGTANDNLGLVGQPAGPATGTGGTMHAPTTGTDIDPLEGSAYSGPALGGDPLDLEFGSTTLGLDFAPSFSNDNDDGNGNEDEGDTDDDDQA